MDGPHLGVVLPNYGEAFDPGRLAAAAVAAEEAGLDSGWMTDHLLPPARHAGIYGTIAEALVTVGWLAGCTSRLRLGTSALIVPQREPLLTLKQLVTLDVLSGGRLVTAVAAGWMEEEFQTLGASFPDRGRRLDEWLDLVGDLLRQAPGRVVAEDPVEISDAWLAPGPSRPEGLELWVAGTSRHTLRRAAKTGVWHPVALPLRELRSIPAAFRAEVPEGRVVLRLAVAVQDRLEEEAADERGRHMVAGPARWVAEQLNDYLEAGADGFVLDAQERLQLVAGPHLRGAISISPSVEYMERAYDEAKYGRFSRRPYIDMVIPSLTDPSVAPPGKHVMSCFVQYAPYNLKEGTWDEKRDEFGDTVVDTIAEHAPNIRELIRDRQVLTPLDLEREFGLSEGNIFQGELTLEQLFFLRPAPGWAQYRTPIKNLWMCGSATHPGGGIMGAPGRNAALQLLKEWK